MDQNPKKKDNLFDFLKKNKNIIIDDFIYIYTEIKKKKILEIFIFIFIFLPFMWFNINLFIISIFYNICKIIREFSEKYILKYIHKEKTVKPMKCKIESTYYNNEVIVFLISIFNYTSKYVAFYYFYNYIKIIKNIINNNIGKKKLLENWKELFLISLRMVLRILTSIILNYSVLIIKISLDIYNIILKCFDENTDFFKTKLQIIFIDILTKYYSSWYIEIKKKRIKFLKKKIKLNMKKGGNLFNKALEYSMFKVQINSKDTEKLKDALKKLFKHTDLRYIQLENNFIKEKKPHTSNIINVDKKNKIMIRATTSEEVEIINDVPMITHTPSKGIINTTKIEKKTNIIETKVENIKNINNPKLVKNVQENPEYIDYYDLAVVNSMENKIYFWDGGLHKDPKYLNIIDKIEKDPNLKKNIEIKKCLDVISEVYQKNLKEYKFKTNHKIFDAVIKTIISKQEQIDHFTLNIILKLIEEE